MSLLKEKGVCLDLDGGGFDSDSLQINRFQLGVTTDLSTNFKRERDFTDGLVSVDFSMA
jgi:hypothetical protein